MGIPRFKPAHIWANPRHFGRREAPDPNPDNLLNQVQTAWAIFQHRAALAVAIELHHRRYSTSDLARDLNEDHAWLVRKLHGQTPADLGDIMNWTLKYGIQILPDFSSSIELQLTSSEATKDQAPTPSG